MLNSTYPTIKKMKKIFIFFFSVVSVNVLAQQNLVPKTR